MEKCFDCNFEQGEVFCKNCQNLYCLSCNFQKHLNIFNQKKGQKILKWHDLYMVCEECEKQKRELYCEECEEYFCLNCFQYFHKKGKRKKHESVQVSEAESCRSISLQIAIIDNNVKQQQLKNFYNFLNKLWYKEKYLLNYIMILNVNNLSIYDSDIIQNFCIKEIKEEFLCEELQNLQKQYNLQVIYNFSNRKLQFKNILTLDCQHIVFRTKQRKLIKSKSLNPIKNNIQNQNSNKSLQYSFFDYIIANKSHTIKEEKQKSKKNSEYLIEEIQKKVQVQTIQFKHPIDHFYQKIHLSDQNQYFCCLAIQQKLHQKALIGEISVHYENFFFQIKNELNQSPHTLNHIFQYLFQNNILQKNIKQFSLGQQLTLISLRNTFLFAHENFLWIILSLKKDKIRFSYQSIIKRIESTFDITMKNEDLFELFDDYIQLKHTINSQKIPKFQNLEIKKIQNEYKIIYKEVITKNGSCQLQEFTDFEDNLEFDEDDETLQLFFDWIQEVFQDNLMTLDIQSIIEITPNNILSTQNSQLGKSQDVFSNSQKADLNCSFLKEDSDRDKLQQNYFQYDYGKQIDNKLLEVNNRKVFPGGIYGFALYTQYYSKNYFFDFTLGKLISLVSNSLKYGALRHYKTFLVKNEDYFENQNSSLQISNINLLEEKSKFLQNFQYTLQNILNSKKTFINLAQLSKSIQECSNLNLQDMSKYGFINKKQLIDLFQDQFSIIEVSEGNFYIGLKQFKEKFLADQQKIKRKKKNKKNLKRQNYSFKNSNNNLNLNPNNISTVQDYIGKIQSTIYNILSQNKQGIELLLLEKKTNKILKSEFDYITFGYDDFYQFLMTHMSQQIEVEVKQINPRERKFIVYLKSNKFGFKDGKEKINNQVKSFYTNDISETNKVINKTIYNMIKQSQIAKNSRNLTKLSNLSINLNKLLEGKQISFALQNQNLSCQSKVEGGYLKRTQ